jgi:hypothetical protein
LTYSTWLTSHEFNATALMAGPLTTSGVPTAVLISGLVRRRTHQPARTRTGELSANEMHYPGRWIDQFGATFDDPHHLGPHPGQELLMLG